MVADWRTASLLQMVLCMRENVCMIERPVLEAFGPRGGVGRMYEPSMHFLA